MGQVIFGLLVMLVVIAILFAGGWYAHDYLFQRRYPEQRVFHEMMEQRLGAIDDPVHQDLVDRSLQKDPYGALLAASSSDSGKDRYQSLSEWLQHGASDDARVQPLALEAAINRQLLPDAAEQFVRSSLSAVHAFRAIDKDNAARVLSELKSLSTDEYRYQAADPSYVQIAPKLTGLNREVFRRHQEFLTPILAASPSTEWESLVSDFRLAQPHVDELYSSQGRIYALIYMLMHSEVDKLTAAGVPEKDALEFLGLNAAIVQTAESDPAWVARVDRMRKTIADTKYNGKQRRVFE